MNDEFIVGSDYPDGYSATFEQDDGAGCLYALKNGQIFQHLHIYNRQTQEPPIKEEDVAIIRSEDGSKVGVVIWRELRGIIKLETSAAFKNIAGITDEEWLGGFDYQLRSDDRGVMRAIVECH